MYSEVLNGIIKNTLFTKLIGSYCSNRDNIILKQKYARETIVLALDLYCILYSIKPFIQMGGGGGIIFFSIL